MAASTNKINFNLEALRGFCALFVVLFHISDKGSLLDSHYSNKIFNSLMPPGHIPVLVFFVLSGYVIGKSNKNNLTGSTIWPYIKKRIVRIYPIYIIAVCLSVLISPSSYPITTVIGNLTFTQVIFTPVISTNFPLWSLNYEVLFYLLFIPVSYFNIKPLRLLAASIVIGVLNFYLNPIINMPLLSSYSWGFSFWVAGLLISRIAIKDEVLKPNYSKLLSALFLIIALATFQIHNHIFKSLTTLLFRNSLQFNNISDWNIKAISFNDLANMPYCIAFILLFLGIELKRGKYFFLALQLLPIVSLGYLIPYYKKTGLELLIAPMLYYALSCILYFTNLSAVDKLGKHIIKAGIWLGSISYGIYIIHAPLLVLLGRLGWESKSLFYFLLKAALLIIATISLSYFLEKIYQPIIKKWLVKS